MRSLAVSGTVPTKGTEVKRINNVDWREYEKAVFEEFTKRYPDSRISWNVHVKGNLSGIDRQIDVLIDTDIDGASFRTAVDTKMYNKAIDIKDVEEFLGLVSDIGVQRGLMVTTVGYSQSALERAHRDLADIELDVMSLAEFKAHQASGAIPFSGPNAIVLPAPFGWIIDNFSVPQFSAVLYQHGRSFEDSARAYEWAYFQFWRKDIPGTPITVDGVLEEQNLDLRGDDSNIEISYIDVPNTLRYPTKIRLAKRSSHPAWEYTGAIEFPDFIFFIVVFTPPRVANRNLRKLIEMLSRAIPASISA